MILKIFSTKLIVNSINNYMFLGYLYCFKMVENVYQFALVYSKNIIIKLTLTMKNDVTISKKFILTSILDVRSIQLEELCFPLN